MAVRPACSVLARAVVFDSVNDRSVLVLYWVVEQFVDRTGSDVRPDAVELWGHSTARAETAMNVRGALQYLDDR